MRLSSVSLLGRVFGRRTKGPVTFQVQIDDFVAFMGVVIWTIVLPAFGAWKLLEVVGVL